MQKTLVALLMLILFTACGGTSKRIVVMSKGAAIFNESAKTITAKDGTGHEQQTISFSDAVVDLKLIAPAGEAPISLKENGLYILNVKNDTIVGSYQKYTTQTDAHNLVTQADLKHKIDSLEQLIIGKNISTTNRNFFIVPNQVVKISDNLEATVVSPYHQMLSAEKVEGKEPEIYRFFSVKEVRETIAKLTALTKPTTK
jgi:hypothetical protein